MGLAASQARLLTITARKADCEFMSMNLSHQKLALSRNMERVSDEYQKALMATKLVYDYQATGQSDMNLTYDLLMCPSIYNDYYPKLVTDSKNRCVLNSAYAAAARAAGIPAEGLIGTPSSDIRNKFIEALANNNVITSYAAASIQAVTYGNSVGLGNTISATVGTEQISYEQLIDLLKTTQGSADYGFALGINYSADYKAVMGDDPHNEGGGNNQTSYFPTRVDNGERLQVISPDGHETVHYGQSSSFNLSLAELLTSENSYMYTLLSAEGQAWPVQDAIYMQQHLVGDQNSFLHWMSDQFYSILGDTSAQSNLALQYAEDAIFDLLYPDSSLQNLYSEFQGKKREDRDNRSNDADCQAAMNKIGTDVSNNKGKDADYWTVVNAARTEYLGVAFEGKNDDHSGKKDRSVLSVNLGTLAQVYLTAYVEYMQGVDNTSYRYEKGKMSNANLYDPNEDDFTFTIASESVIDDGGSDMTAQFYDALFNQICMNGWTENAQIDDREYMTEMMKNGMVFISSMSDDGYYYQSSYSNDKTVIEVADNEAIAQAEAKYSAEKAKIENKEDSLDLKMKNLDTEISSLDQEYNTVKSLISKSIEKSIKRYEA